MTGILAGNDSGICCSVEWTLLTAGWRIEVWKGAETLSLIGLGSWPEKVLKCPIHLSNPSLVPDITT